MFDYLPEIDFIAFDLPAHGDRREWSPLPSLNNEADRIVEELERAGVREFHIIGHSMGGYIGLAIAKLFPKKVRSLQLLNSTPFADNYDRKDKRGKILQLIQKRYGVYLTMNAQTAFSSRFVKANPNAYRQALNRGLECNATGIEQWHHCLMRREDYSVFFQGLRIPTSIVIGEEDQTVDKEELKAYCQTYQIRHKVMNTGHSSLWEDEVKTIAFLVETTPWS